MRVEGVGDDMLLEQIVKIVREAQLSQAPIQKLADIISRYFTPIVLIFSFFVFNFWLFLAPIMGLIPLDGSAIQLSVYVTVTILIIAI